MTCEVGQSKRANETGFNPHTHEGCDTLKLHVNSVMTVSIHTPTKGVTLTVRYVIPPYIVSIHTPTKGVTFSFIQVQPSISCFNPHTHEGCDDERHANGIFTIDVSIHTPTKGVTQIQRSKSTTTTVSIHTPTKGVTLIDIFK